MRRSRLAVTICLLLASLSAFAIAGPIGISDYSGPRFPYSSSFYSGTYSSSSGLSIRVGFWMDDQGLRSATRFHGDPDSLASGFPETGSASDPSVLYVYTFRKIHVIRFDGVEWQQLHEIPLHFPIQNTLVSFITVIPDRDGADLVFFRPQLDSIAVVIDTDGDGIADKILDRNGDSFDDEIKFGDFNVTVVGPSGMGYGFDSEIRPFPNSPLYFINTILDTDGDSVPDTPAWPGEPRGRAEIDLPYGSGTEGVVDFGSDRLVFGRNLPAVIDLDGDGFPIPTSCRRIPIAFETIPGDEDGGNANEPQRLLHDGAMAAYWVYFGDTSEANNPKDPNHGVYILDDIDFDGIITFRSRSNPVESELRPALTQKMFDPAESPGTPVVPCLTELRSFVGGIQAITFADFGIWPDGRAFSFRQAGIERTTVTVSLDGFLSFVGPVTASPSLATLESTPGLLAPAWSNQWDTSQVRVFAGCAPTQRRFADGSGSAALSFVIEWRGLISPNGKRTSLRCLLLEDGSFRVDYGAMEIGSMPIVVGYSTDGAGAIISDDLSDNSWGGQPAGTLEEAKLGEEFGVAKPFDLQHKWIRFSGYGDVRGPRPEILSAVLKKGNRIQMRATGSNIQTGATLVVDGTETFELAKSGTGSKWVVSKKATSAPGSRSVASIWSDGQSHSIVVVNPDGGRSTTTELQ